jgi:hypothetical protein
MEEIVGAKVGRNTRRNLRRHQTNISFATAGHDLRTKTRSEGEVVDWETLVARVVGDATAALREEGLAESTLGRPGMRQSMCTLFVGPLASVKQDLGALRTNPHMLQTAC